MKLKTYIIAGAIVLTSILGFIGGYKTYPRINPCPTITTDTVFVHDTIWYTMHDTVINTVTKKDTIFVPVEIPADVDTAQILKDYFSVYRYLWEKQDSNISLKLYTTVTKNQPIAYDISYKWLKPQQVIVNNIDNTITYNKYLYIGASLPVYPLKDSIGIATINHIGLDAIYAFPKGYIGAQWKPYDNVISAKVGIKLFTFKKIK